jgi:hypothetical protein
MRENSPEQSESSSENGSKSVGPITPAGKQKSSQNALRDGLFSRRVIIEALGEKDEDFEKLTKSYLDSLQPTTVLEKQLTRDIVDNLWMRGRAQRAEELDLANRLEVVELQNELVRADELETLRPRFVALFEDYLTGLNAQSLRFPTELEEARRELLSTPDGIDFFLEALDFLAAELELNKQLTAKQKLLFRAIDGRGSAENSAAWLFSLT